MRCYAEWCSVFICSPVLLAATQSQVNLERTKSRMGTFVEGGPVGETNPDEGYETNIIIMWIIDLHTRSGCDLHWGLER